METGLAPIAVSSPGQFERLGAQFPAPNSTDGEPFPGAQCLDSAAVTTSAFAGSAADSSQHRKRGTPGDGVGRGLGPSGSA